eukprot:EG_transcript_9350
MGNCNNNGIYVELAAGRSGPGRYQPGETVTGQVHLNIQTEFSITGVMLKVSGAEVAWGKRCGQRRGRRGLGPLSQRRPGLVATAVCAPCTILVASAGSAGVHPVPYALDGPRRNRHAQVHEHFKVAVPLMQPNAQGRLATGQYSVPFSFTLPADCLPSFCVGSHRWGCAVEYSVKAVCKLPGLKANLKHVLPFSVTGVMPAHPAALAIREYKSVPAFGCLGSSGHVQMDFNVDRNIWFAGDRLECTGVVANDSTKDVRSVAFRLQRVITVQRRRGRVTSVVTDVAQSSFPGVAPQARKDNLHLTLNLPADLVPSCRGRCFDVRYVLSVDCNVSWAKDPQAQAEVIICAAQGTAPSPLPPPPGVPSQWQPAVLQPVVVPALVCAAAPEQAVGGKTV